MSRFSFGGDATSRLGGGAILVLVCIVLLAPTLNDAGPEMDEGTLVAYPSLVLDGLVPGKDFETFYGPGEPWLVAGAYTVLGESVETERIVGLLFRVGFVLAIFAMLVPWGMTAAFAGGLLSLLVSLTLAANALPLFDAIALGLGSLALMVLSIRRGRELRGDRSGPRLALAAGVLAGLALLFRPDLVFAVAAGSAPLLIAAERLLRIRWLIGVLIACIPLLVWLVLVGPDGISRLLGDLSDSRSGRKLPLPSPGSLEGQALIASALAIAATLGFAERARRRDSTGIWAATLFALGLFALLLIPATIQRADDAHVLPLASVAVAPLPALVVSALALRKRTMTPLRMALIGLTGVAALVSVVLAVRAAGPSIRDGILGGGPESYDVRTPDRSFPIADEQAAADLTAIVNELEQTAEPGQTFFTGPRDLRRTNYADTFLYFLLEDLKPASFYTEVNPGTANAEDSGLADELRQADFLILTTRYDDFVEDNSSTEFGSDEPNEVVRRDFKRIARSGSYELFENTGAS